MAAKQLAGRVARERVTEQIREALREGDLVPGQRLVELDLSEAYEVSRSAVREALSDLASDGLVELIPNRGARIRVVSVEEAIQVTECRSALECLCARKAAEGGTAAQRETLASIADSMRTAVEQADLEGYSALNRELHSLVIEMSGQYVAARQLERLNAQTVRFQFRLARRPGRPQESLPQHLAIIEAIRAGEPAEAEAAMRAHLDSVIAQIAATDSRGVRPGQRPDLLSGQTTAPDKDYRT
ncbi:DNA-binding transcriptional regulator, GntR family [Microlunatus soli]|uniref:DNA-binding transcriptional regulator, GntR family n=1 Tax=Microlunatus soli TaxID=630515 RepID=A0A1H1YLV6_9ACTN|nr:GntR family transcriptional regulator [Microlunatus soli]SDT22433.1 DNA-binding transcriptional regulator, GntR family [Microlunatus soli]